MIKEKEKILVIEDKVHIREGLTKTLRIYGFDAIGAESISHSLEILNNHENKISVIIADMHIERYSDYKKFKDQNYEKFKDQTNSNITGIDLIRVILNDMPTEAPEIIILSGHENFEYYKKAIKAGATDYLLKHEPEDIERLIPLVQALSLKQAFLIDLIKDDVISDLIEGISNVVELIDNFLLKNLIPKLNLCIGKAKYVLLYQQKNQPVSVYSEIINVPQKHEFDYSIVHEKIFSTNSEYAYYSEADFTASEKSPGNMQNFEFVKLIDTDGVKLAIGIPTDFPVKDMVRVYGFSTEYLTIYIYTQVKPYLVSFFDRLILNFQKEQNVRLERLRTFIEWSDLFQRSVNNLLPDEKPETIEQASLYFKGFSSFSHQIQDYTQYLNSLLDFNNSIDSSREKSKIWLSEIVREIENEYSLNGFAGEILFRLEEDCYVSAENGYFKRALREIVKWAFDRRDKVSSKKKQTITIECENKNNHVEITISENSARRPKTERIHYLFEPMTPLHLAKLIIEFAFQGNLYDVTDEMKTESGHSFRFILPHFNGENYFES